jgi:hypothetical protein
MNVRALLVTIALPACLLKPSPPGNGTNDGGQTGDGGSGSGGSGSGSGGSGSGSSGGSDGSAMVPRVLAKAWYSDVGMSQNMGSSAYWISTFGVQDGDFLLLIANMDNGSDDEFVSPPNFTKLDDHYYYGGDGQTFYAAYAVANGEPDHYSEAYKYEAGSRMTAMALIAIAGADTSDPPNVSNYYLGTSAVVSPQAEITSSDDITTVNNCAVVVAAGADWLHFDTSVAEEMPSQVPLLAELTDQGDLATDADWTSLTVGWFPQVAAGPLPDYSITLATGSADMGEAWGVVIAVAPAP